MREVHGRVKPRLPCGPMGPLNVPQPGPKSLGAVSIRQLSSSFERGSRSKLFAQLAACPRNLRCALDGRLCSECPAQLP